MTLKELLKEVRDKCENDSPLITKEQRRIYQSEVKRLMFPKTAKFGKSFYRLLAEKAAEFYKATLTKQ